MTHRSVQSQAGAQSRAAKPPHTCELKSHSVLWEGFRIVFYVGSWGNRQFRVPIFKLPLWLQYLCPVLVADISGMKISENMWKYNGNVGQILIFHCITMPYHALDGQICMGEHENNPKKHLLMGWFREAQRILCLVNLYERGNCC